MTEIRMSGKTYRRMDTASKLVGLALVAAALEVGPLTAAGLGLVVAGIAFGTITVFVNTHE
jgi:hypothetical protein